MKLLNHLFSAFIVLSFIFTTACEKDDPKPESNEPEFKVIITNYGNYGETSGTFSLYNPEEDSLIHNAYKKTNDLAYNSNMESIALHDGKIYSMGNNGDKIDVMEPDSLEQIVNPISDSITKPRYFAAKDDKAFISCWGNIQDWSKVKNSYIAVINTENNAFEEKIALPGGPEGIIISNNKIFTVLEYKKEMAIINLDDYSITYQPLDAIGQHIVEDKNGDLWISMVSTYSDPAPADSLGLMVFDPVNEETKKFIKFSGISGDGVLATSGDKDSVFVMGKEAYPGTASSIYAVDVSKQTLSSEALVKGDSYNGFGINPENSDIYVLISPSASESGSMKIYDATGKEKASHGMGLAPKQVLFLD